MQVTFKSWNSDYDILVDGKRVGRVYNGVSGWVAYRDAINDLPLNKGSKTRAAATAALLIQLGLVHDPLLRVTS